MIELIEKDVKKEDNWLVPIYDRVLGKFLHDEKHPYNPFENKNEKHQESFIDSIFCI